TTTHYGLIGYCLFDLTWLVLMELLSEFILLEGSRSLISISNWLTDLSVWVMPIFSFLIITNTYVRIWRNSFFRDYIILVLAIFSGCIFTLALLFIFNKESVFYCVNQVVLFCFFSLIGIVGVRIFHQFLREWGFSRANSHVHNRKNMLVYGASGHGGLYIRELYLRYAEELGKIHVVGFVDDNKALHRQYTFGLLVLGGVCELEKLILQYKINQIVLTVRLPKEKFYTLIELCSRMGVELLVWNSFTYIPNNAEKT
ncbi:MAG: hypothetical protein KAG26_09150, partial [Methylococcales bacterium]|nr:hypothetical protein [Methylococcales bacterium]